MFQTEFEMLKLELAIASGMNVENFVATGELCVGDTPVRILHDDARPHELIFQVEVESALPVPSYSLARLMLQANAISPKDAAFGIFPQTEAVVLNVVQHIEMTLDHKGLWAMLAENVLKARSRWSAIMSDQPRAG